MTTIASFATIQNQQKEIKDQHVSSVYILSDSQISFLESGNITKTTQGQKVFFDKPSNLIFSYFGDAIVGNKIMQEAFATIATNASIRLSQTIIGKKNNIKIHFDKILATIPKNIRNSGLNIFCITAFEKNFCAFLLGANVPDTSFNISDVGVYTQPNIYTGGSGGEKFAEFFKSNTEKYCEENKTAVYFNSFFEFLENKKDPLTSLPCQGVVMDLDGNIKVLSIKHDEKFYVLGKEHSDRANFNYEIDYRDKYFEFLHSDGKIRGNNRKHFHFKDCSQQ